MDCQRKPLPGIYVANHKLYANTYKIGFSHDIEKRMRNYKTTYRDAPELQYTITGDIWNTPKTLKMLEQLIFDKLARWRCGKRELFTFPIEVDIYECLTYAVELLNLCEFPMILTPIGSQADFEAVKHIEYIPKT